MSIAASESLLSQDPNIITPRHSGLIKTPVRPSRRDSILS